MALWRWVSDKAANFASSLSSSYQTVTSTISSLSIWPSSNQYMSGNIAQSWEGLTRFIDMNTFTRIGFSPKTRATLFEMLKANAVCYLSVAVLFEMTRTAIVNYATTDEDNWTNASIKLTINSAVFIAMTALYLRRYYDNTLLNMVLTKQIGEENPLSPYFKTKEYDLGAMIKAGIYSPLILTSKIASILVADFVPIANKVTPVAYIYTYGESLAEYPYSAAGMSLEQRAERLASHPAYSFGLGVSMYALAQGLSYLISRYTGAESMFITNAIYSAIYPYFVTAVLLRDREIPTVSKKIDLSYYHRLVTEQFSYNLGNQLVSYLRKPGTAINFDYLAGLLDNRVGHAMRWLLSLDFYGDWYSINKFVLNKPNKILMDEYYDSLKYLLDEIIKLRHQDLNGRPLSEKALVMVAPHVAKLPSRFTKLFITNTMKNVIKFVYEDWLEEPLVTTRDLLVHVRLMQKNSNINTVKYDELKWANQVNQPQQPSSSSGQPTVIQTKPEIETPKEKAINTKSSVAVLSHSDIPSVVKTGVFAMTSQVNSSSQSMQVKQVDLIAKRRDYLLNLKRNVLRSFWDKKGVGLFGAVVPDKIDKLRNILLGLSQSTNETEVNKTFIKVKNLFSNNPPDANRHPDVAKLYSEIVHDVGKLIGTNQSLVTPVLHYSN